MRNLKKFLALVLAMMMTLGLMVTANASVASDFTDAESITKEFTEAVAVLEGLDVFTGYENGTFQPKKGITRAEVATIVYRLATGDVEGKQADLYKDYQKFTDVKSTDWYAGYVNYCSNAEWIKGYGDGTFGPNKSVTGYQAAAMILRAVGYDKNKEFSGTGWQVQVANFTRSLGLLTNVDNTTYKNTLNNPAPRELVAEILFQAGLINTVSWNQLSGYQPGSTIPGMNDTRGLAWQNFGLDVGPWISIDKWGRSGYEWTNKAGDTVAQVELEYDYAFHDGGHRECDVAEKLGIKTNDTYRLYVNNKEYITDKYLIEATDTVTRVGGEGRLVEFYKKANHPWAKLYEHNYEAVPNEVIMIDTYLATVTNVTERVVDPAGHEITPSYLYLDVYDGDGVGTSVKNGSITTQNTSEHRVSKSGENWTFVKGDKVLIQGYTNYSTVKNHAPANGTTSAGIEANNKAAFETNRLLPAGTNYANDDSKTAATNAYTNINVVKKADFKPGKQTVTTWNTGKHTVDGNEYPDAITLFLDEAKTTTNTTYAWYFDEYENIIGIDNMPDNVNYGVITSIYSAFNQGDDATTGTAKAVANVTYADGSTGTVTIDRFLVNSEGDGNNKNGHQTSFVLPNYGNVMVDPGKDASVLGSINASGIAPTELVPVYDYNNTGSSVMTATDRTGVTSVNNAQYTGMLYVAPVASINTANDANDATHYGIIRGNMFKFVASTDGNMTAIEVAGHKANGFKADGTTPQDHADENTGLYEWNYNGKVNGANGILSKTFSYIDLDTSSPNSSDVWLDSDTYIMVRNGNAVTAYTIDTLGGDVTLASNSEVDWADPDGDGRAEYVYVTGTVSGDITYGLFYYNGGAAQWNGVDKVGTMNGYLNGDPTTVTFRNETLFNVVRNSQAYAGHLFALQLTNNVVSAVMNKDSLGTHNYLLYNYVTPANTSGTKIGAAAPGNSFTTEIGIGTAAGSFGLGQTNAKFNNPYTTSTEAVYYLDNDTASAVSYNPSNRTVTVRTDSNADGKIDNTDTAVVYFLSATSKVRGLGMGVTQEDAILDYLNKSTTNDVTIVYEQAGVNSIVEIYVATDPNVTPPTGTNTFSVSVRTDALGISQYNDGLVNISNGSSNNIDFADFVMSLNGVAYDFTANSAVPVVTVKVEQMNLLGGFSNIGTYRLVLAGTTAVAGENGTEYVLNGGAPDTIAVSFTSGQTYRLTATVSDGNTASGHTAAYSNVEIVTNQIVTCP